LVAKHFVPNPNGYNIVNHIDNNPLNNNADNLEWCTDKMNQEHSRSQNRQFQWIFNKELLIACINLIENYDYNYADLQRLTGVPRSRFKDIYRHHCYKRFDL